MRDRFFFKLLEGRLSCSIQLERMSMVSVYGIRNLNLEFV